jgi:prepilin-type processing-associated H-X9-DG protein
LTLVEGLVVLAILGVLMGLMLPAVQRVRHAAWRTHCAHNLRQIGLALQGYHDTQHSFPPGVSYRNGADPYPFMSWNTRLLPYLEQQPLWRLTLDAFARDRRFGENPPHVGLATVLPAFSCPVDSRTLRVGFTRLGRKPVAFTAYLGVEGRDQVRRDGLLYLDSATRLADVTDGSSHTLLVGERPPSADGVLGWWYGGQGQSLDGSADMVLGVRERNMRTWTPQCAAPIYEFGPGRVENQCDALHFWSLHAGGGAHFLFADGSTHFLRYELAPILPALATRSGGEAAALLE